MKLVSVAAAAMVLGLGTGTAFATTYDLTGLGYASAPDVTLDSLASLHAGCGGSFQFTGCSLTFGAAGIGVNGSPDTDPSDIDNFPANPFPSWEQVMVSFASPVTLLGFTLGNFNTQLIDFLPFGLGQDDYSLYINNALVTSGSTTNPNFGGWTNVSSFAVRATRDGRELGNDEFTLASFDVVAAVPLPAGVVLMGSALLGLAGLGLRRKAAAKAA
jgi:hypothetical protein